MLSLCTLKYLLVLVTTYPLTRGNIFKNQTLIPGQKITNLLDKKSMINKRTDHRITAKYKTIIAGKTPKQPIQKSNTFVYKPLSHTVPVMSALTQRYD